MTRDDIIRLARECEDVSLDDSTTNIWVLFTEQLEHFAALVAAAERESCAKLCEEIARRNEAECDIDWVTGNMECADYIRARGKP